jgi:hypothetical protein
MEGGGMAAAQPVDPLGIDMVSGLAQQHAAEQAMERSITSAASASRHASTRW